MKTVIILLVLASCARQAEDIKATRSYLTESTRPIFSRALGELVVDPEIRAISFIIYPDQDDLEGFEYTPNGEVGDLWDSVTTRLSYGVRLNGSYRREASPKVKLSQMVTTIVTVGELRTDTFRAMAPLEYKADQMSVIIKSENSSLKEQLGNFSCFYTEVAEDGTYQCQWEQREENPLSERSVGSCRKLDKYNFNQGPSTPEGENKQTLWENLTQACRLLSEKREVRSETLELIDAQGRLRKEAESILLDLLFAAEEHSQEKVFLALGASKERKSEDEAVASTLVMNREASAIEGLRLFLDFGANYSGGVGLQEYSTGNGKITNLRLEKRDWADLLKFTLQTSDFRVDASLSMTVQEYVDLRFVGDIRVKYPDGSVSDGVMALELDRSLE